LASKTRETRSQALAGSSIQVGEASLVTPTPATRVRKKVVRWEPEVTDKSKGKGKGKGRGT